MPYITSDGTVAKKKSVWRLQAIPEFFWGVLNFFVFFSHCRHLYRTLFRFTIAWIVTFSSFFVHTPTTLFLVLVLPAFVARFLLFHSQTTLKNTDAIQLQLVQTSNSCHQSTVFVFQTRATPQRLFGTAHQAMHGSCFLCLLFLVLKFKHDFHDKFKHHEGHQQYVHGKDNDGNQNMCAGINVINLIDQQTAPGQLKRRREC